MSAKVRWRLVWAVLRGRSVMYRMDVDGGVTLQPGSKATIAECTFSGAERLKGVAS